MTRLDEIAERHAKATGWERAIRQMPSENSGFLRTEIMHKDPRIGWFVLATLGSFEQNVGDAEQMCHSLADIDTLLRNTRNALAFIDKMLAGDHNSQQLAYLRRIERILTGLDDGRGANETEQTR